MNTRQVLLVRTSYYSHIEDRGRLIFVMRDVSRHIEVPLTAVNTTLDAGIDQMVEWQVSPDHEVTGLSEEMLRRLNERAHEQGVDRSQVSRDFLIRELVRDPADIADQSFDAALAPIRAGFADSGMSEEAAETLLVWMPSGFRTTQ